MTLLIKNLLLKKIFISSLGIFYFVDRIVHTQTETRHEKRGILSGIQPR